MNRVVRETARALAHVPRGLRSARAEFEGGQLRPEGCGVPAFRAGGVRIGAKRQTITQRRASHDNNTGVRQEWAFGMGCAQLPNVCSFWRACSASSVRGYSVRIFCSTNFASVVSPVAAKASANISRAAGALSPLR